MGKIFPISKTSPFLFKTTSLHPFLNPGSIAKILTLSIAGMN
ncbi:hypothetical protein [Mycoplasmopsis cynos]